MDRLRIVVWRNLLKKLYRIYGDNIDFEIITKAVALSGGDEKLNECICIVGNLIYEGYAKGYIFQNETKRVLVLKTNGAFQPLAAIAK